MRVKSPIVSLDIGNYVVEAMIDTGSEYTLVKQQTTQTMGIPVNTTKHVPPLQGITGKKLRILGSIDAEVRIGDEVVKSRMLVVPDHYIYTYQYW